MIKFIDAYNLRINFKFLNSQIVRYILRFLQILLFIKILRFLNDFFSEIKHIFRSLIIHENYAIAANRRIIVSRTIPILFIH